jgi:hypothetical protein
MALPARILIGIVSCLMDREAQPPRTVSLWCRLLGRQVEAGVKPGRGMPRPVAGLPEGWVVSECLGRCSACYETGCPFTTDSLEWPFGDPGE